MEGLEKERDFYFGKLRDIEVYCQEQESIESNPAIQKILEVLYATEVNTPSVSLFIDFFFVFFFAEIAFLCSANRILKCHTCIY